MLREDNIAKEMLGKIVNDLVIHDVPPNGAPFARNLFPVDDVDDVDESKSY
jgi:hypothetical protein